MTDARRRQEAERERGAQKGLDRLGGLSRIKVTRAPTLWRQCFYCRAIAAGHLPVLRHLLCTF